MDGLGVERAERMGIDDIRRRLLGLRLGKHERRILLLLPRHDAAEGIVVPPLGEGRSAYEAHYRALRRLLSLGLIEQEWKVGWVQKQRHRTLSFILSVSPGGRTHREPLTEPKPVMVWFNDSKYYYRLSQLGEAVLQSIRMLLETNQPVRWEKYLNDIVGAMFSEEAS